MNRYKKSVALVFMLFAPSGYAWEFRDNPDRFPSVGLTLATTSLVGTKDEIDQPNPALSRDQGGPISSVYHSFGADVRLPVADQMTVTVFGSQLASSSSFNRVGNIYRESAKMEGYQYGASVRIYIGK